MSLSLKAGFNTGQRFIYKQEDYKNIFVKTLLNQNHVHPEISLDERNSRVKTMGYLFYSVENQYKSWARAGVAIV